MKTLKRRRWSYVLVLAITWIGWASAGRAQQMQLPVHGSQTTPRFQYLPQPSPSVIPSAPSSPSSSRVQTIPQLQQAQPEITPPPASVYVPAPQYTPPPAPVYRAAPQPTPPPLPAIFRGCWKGRVDFVDSIQRLPGGARVGPWTPKTYLLCYRRTGNGPFELTFTDAGIAHSRKIINATGKMDVVSTNGRTYASMRSLLHFDEYRLPNDPAGRGT